MTIITILAVILLGLFAVTVFSKDLRNKILDQVKVLFNKGFSKAPVAIDLVVDPLKEQIIKFKGV
jgi:hypothetical protein